jgi:hypothetical protein
MMSRVVFWAMAAGVMAGCASKPKDVYHAGDETPPDFLTGPAVVLLTNLDGYSAHLTAMMPQASGIDRAVAGDLLERDGRLIFQPAAGSKGKRSRTAGGTFFMWDAATQAGYVLSDPLQAYAPIATKVEVTNIVVETSSAMEDEVVGHSCRRVEVVVESNDGTAAHFLVWQAEDAKHFPMKIQSTSNLRAETLEFTDLRLELPATELFLPPDGFTRYASATALMNELIVRQTSLGTHYNKEDDASLPNPGPVNNWRPAQPQ